MKPMRLIKAIILAICLCVIASQTFSALGQVALVWANPAKIPGLHESGLNPIFLADSAGTIHLFHSQPVGDNLSIFYIRWTYKEGWSTLVDIIKAPRGDARVYGVHLDQKGWLHLIFFGGDDLSADLFYTKAPAIYAGKSTAWGEPVLIGSAAITPSDAALIGDGQDFLMAAYSGNLKGNGIYIVRSLDGGQTWSAPEAMFITYSDVLWPYAFCFSQGSSPNIYAAWSLKDETGNSQAIYFSRFDQKLLTWQRPLLLAAVTNFTADTPALIERQNQLIIVYHNDFPSTRWMRLSTDAGNTWSRPVRLFDQVGSNGAAALVMDSQQQLYMLFGNRVGDPAIHGAWQSEWLGERWSQPVAIVSGPQIVVGPNGEEGFDPSFVQATIVQGNILFALWRHDPRAGPTNLWYTYRILAAPANPMQPLPTVIFTPTPIYTSEPITTLIPGDTATVEIHQPAPSLTPTFDQSPPTNPNISNPNLSILAGIIPVGFLIVVAIFIQKRQR